MFFSSLGYQTGQAVSRGALGTGLSFSWFSRVSCSGREQSILQCRSRALAESDCGGRDSVGAICWNGKNHINSLEMDS